MDQTLQGLLGIDCFVYLDDIVVYSTTIQEHLEKLTRIFERIAVAKLILQPKKCHFLKKEIIYLGHKCSTKGCEPDPEKTSAIQSIQEPSNAKQIQCFIGIANYYRRFIPNFAKLSLPLIKLTRNKTPFIWKGDYIESFNSLKTILSSNNVLVFPNFKKSFEISTDASNEALDAVLSQESRPIAFASKTLNKTEIKYSTIEKELLGVVWGVNRFRCYVYGQEFTVFTDHKSLLGIHKMKDPSSRLLRLYLKLSEYSIILKHKPGKHNIIADGLSRLPVQVNVLTRSQTRNLKKLENETRKVPRIILKGEHEWEDISESQLDLELESVEDSSNDSEWEDIEDDGDHIAKFYKNTSTTFVKNTNFIMTTNLVDTKDQQERIRGLSAHTIGQT